MEGSTEEVLVAVLYLLTVCVTDTCTFFGKVRMSLQDVLQSASASSLAGGGLAYAVLLSLHFKWTLHLKSHGNKTTPI